MAGELNVFRTITAVITTVNEIVYTAPLGKTTIILMAQATNISENVNEISFLHFDAATNSETELVKGFSVPPNDATSVITGKLIVEEGNSVRAFASEDDAFKMTFSILESLNA